MNRHKIGTEQLNSGDGAIISQGFAVPDGAEQVLPPAPLTHQDRDCPGEPVSRLPLLTVEEQRQIVVDWNQTSVTYPQKLCLHQLVEARVALSPDATAVVAAEGELTYEQLNARANQLAFFLRRCGVGADAPVAICLERSLDLMVATLGVLKAGGACVPLDPKYPVDRLGFMLQDVQASVLITQVGLVPPLASITSQIIYFAENPDIAAQPRHDIDTEVAPDSLAYVLYTSGSTGTPKGVLLTHRGLSNYALAIGEMCRITSADRVLQFFSPSFDGSIEEIFATWVAGATLVLRSEEMSFSIPSFLEWIERYQVSVLDLPTAFWHEWVHELSQLDRPIPESVRMVIVGGEKCFHSALAEWLRFAPGSVRWINTYGPTEASIGATSYEPGPDALQRSVLPIGRPLPNILTYILDRQLNPVPVGVPGELHIGGVGVARGYMNRPEVTREKFIADPFSPDANARLYKTGDLARYLPSGEIEYLGREDDQVKIRGFRIELGEIEEVVVAHPSVREAAVVVRETIPGSKRIMAYVVPASDPFTENDLRRYLREKLPEYMFPSDFVVLPALPLTPNGKVDRRSLPAPVSPTIRCHTNAGDALELQLVAIWEEVLNTRPIGAEQNFFEIGGHSLLAARLMYRLEQALGRRLPIALLFQAPTIAGFAALLREKEWRPSWSSLVPMQTQGSRPPFFCVHGVGGNIIGFNALALRLQPEQPFYGLQAQGLNGANRCHASVEEMAAHYISEIRKVQPQGPYFIGGFSFGGLVAYEMAQQLTEKGECVGSLMLLDTYTATLMSKTVSLANILFSDRRKELLAKLPAALKKSLKRRFGSWQIPANLKRVRDACSQAAADYVLKPYRGRVTLFCACEQSLRSSNSMYSGWVTLAEGGFEVHEIAGDHNGMLREPQVAALAAELKSCLEAAQPSHAELRTQDV